jgi:hypothetical protein
MPKGPFWLKMHPSLRLLLSEWVKYVLRPLYRQICRLKMSSPQHLWVSEWFYFTSLSISSVHNDLQHGGDLGAFVNAIHLSLLVA